MNRAYQIETIRKFLDLTCDQTFCITELIVNRWKTRLAQMSCSRVDSTEDGQRMQQPCTKN